MRHVGVRWHHPCPAVALIAATPGVRRFQSTSPVDVLERAAKAKLDKEAFERQQAERRATLHGAKSAQQQQQAPPRAKPAAASASAATGEPPKPATHAFLKRLHNMHHDMYETRKDVNITLKKEAKAQVKLEERRTMLRFRDVDTELDRIMIWRDFFGWILSLKKGGLDNLVDQALERELRFYAEESNKEIKYNPKLFQGLPFLNQGHFFPTLTGLTRLSSTPAQQAKLEKLRKEMNDGAAKSDESETIVGQVSKGSRTSGAFLSGDKRSGHQLLGTGDDKGGVTLTRNDFTKPTLVTMSQLTYATSYQQFDLEWVRLLREDDDGGDHTTAKPNPTELGLRRPPSARKALFNPNNFNVLRLRTVDTHSVAMMRGVVTDMWAKTASITEARETLIGNKLVREFMPNFGLRNFSTTYCFLLDNKGRVRWMSAGAPNTAERDLFPTLLRDLELDMHRGPKA